MEKAPYDALPPPFKCTNTAPDHCRNLKSVFRYGVEYKKLYHLPAKRFLLFIKVFSEWVKISGFL
jgi:hypothetical protein